MSDRLIDLSSDTATRPSPEMRRFIAEAPVGDEQSREDPTVNLLEEMVAELLQKDAAVFLPSGTMCNLVAIKVHCRPGDELLLHRTAHPYTAEGGGAAGLAGVSCWPLDGPRGVFTGADVAAAVKDSDPHHARTRMVSIENTANSGGGKVWPLETVQDVARVAHAHGLKTHMDGARLLNAVVASGIPAATYAAELDTVWIDLSKGLGAPVGGVLAGNADDMVWARRFKHQLGGAMRQAGIIAAAGVYALRHNVERLAEDHANARLLAEGLATIPGLRLDPSEVETNIVFFDVSETGRTGEELNSALTQRGARMGGWGTTIRAVTHLDTPRADVERAVELMRDVVLHG
jgi:threonine aldolase